MSRRVAASVEPSPGCDPVWPGRRVAGNLGRRRADTDGVNAKHASSPFAGRRRLAPRTRGEPAAEERKSRLNQFVKKIKDTITR
jgi:hypothetical protein